MSKGRGYLLPEGDAYTADLRCAIVFYPDKDEYLFALGGSLDYLGTWIAWERDEAKRGKDAARAWRDATELTRECWDMACLDQLQEDVSAIRLLLQQQACCGSTSITYAPTTITTTTIIPGVGDDPTVYGETEVATWEEWLQHLCYQSHNYVDQLIHYGETASNLFDAGGLTLDAWSSLLGLMNFVGLALPLFVGDLMVWLADFLLATTSTWFDTAASDLEAGRDDIVCALQQGADLGTAVSDALGIGSEAWLSFYSLIDYDNVQAILYEGGIDDDFLPTELRDDCDVCGYEQQSDSDVYVDEIYGVDWDYDTEAKEWSVKGEAVSGCVQVQFKLWETPSRITEKPCRIVVTSCGPDIVKCGGNYMEHGFLGGFVEWEHDHPPLAGLELAAIDQYQHLHVALSDYTITFKLYL